MGVRKLIENEINSEQRILKRLKREDLIDDVYLLCKESKGKRRFYFKNNGGKKLTYVNKAEMDKAEHLLMNRLYYEMSMILDNNISVLSKALNKIRDYDIGSVLEGMPSAYKKIDETLRRAADPDKDDTPFPQSENPKDRKGLKHKTSFGLMVRSKNEMLIAEALYSADLVFQYEKRLELVRESNGMYNTEDLYPDFTIFLPDGDVIYWEHMGMWEKEDYKEDNIKRMTLYFQNGIYPPKNLILTFDGKEMPFDNSATWRIIEGLILSRC